MKIWVDAQLSPHLAPWLNERFGVEAYSVRRLGYRDASTVLDTVFAQALVSLREGESIVEITDLIR